MMHEGRGGRILSLNQSAPFCLTPSSESGDRTDMNMLCAAGAPGSSYRCRWSIRRRLMQSVLEDLGRLSKIRRS
jgi:hypothetical protein